jgi:hypothetical protein
MRVHASVGIVQQTIKFSQLRLGLALGHLAFPRSVGAGAAARTGLPLRIMDAGPWPQRGGCVP